MKIFYIIKQVIAKTTVRVEFLIILNYIQILKSRLK